MKTTLFKIFTGIAGTYHILLGLSGLFLSHDLFEKVVSLILGINSEMDTTLQFAAKFASVYVLAFGITLLILMKNPVKYRMLALPVLTLFGLRLINKLIYFEGLSDTFNISFAQNIFAVVSIAILFFGILFTLPKKEAND